MANFNVSLDIEAVDTISATKTGSLICKKITTDS